MQVGFDKEGRVLEHGMEEVERALQRRQVVQIGGDLPRGVGCFLSVNAVLQEGGCLARQNLPVRRPKR